MAEFADIDSSLLASFEDLDKLFGHQESGSANVKATLRRTKKQDVDLADPNFAVISLEELEKEATEAAVPEFKIGDEVLAISETDGRRRKAVVREMRGLGLFRVQFVGGEKEMQDVYVTMLSKPTAAPQEDFRVESTDVATSTDEHGNAVVTTTLVVRNVVTNEVFKKSTRETRAQHRRDLKGTVRPGASNAPSTISKPPRVVCKEFLHCMAELLNTERDFATRLEAVVLFYETPIREQKLLPETAIQVVFGKNTLAQMVASSRVCTKALEESKTPEACITAFWDYLFESRGLYGDQIMSRSLGHVPLQGYLQSNTKFRKFATAQVAKVEEWFLTKGIQSHGHLGSVLYAPIQRLPRVLLLVKRMKSLNDVGGVDELIQLIQAMLDDFEQG